MANENEEKDPTLFFEEDEDEREAPRGAAAVAPGAAPAPGVARAQVGSGRAPNVQRYLQANIGAGQRLAGGIQQRATEEAERARRGVEEVQQRFGQQAAPLEQELGEQAEQRIQTAFQDPQQLLQQQQQLAQFQRLRDAGMQADIAGLQTDVSPYQQQQQAIQQAAQQAGTEAGRYQLLQQAYGRPEYTRGMSRLDQLLLQADPGAAREMQMGLRGTATGLGETIGAAGEEMATRRAALSGLAGERAGQIGQLLRTGRVEGLAPEEQLGQMGYEDIEAAVTQRLAEAQQQAPEQFERLRSGLQAGALTEAQVQELGLTPEMQLYDIDLSKYLAGEGRAPTAAGVTTEEELARLRALQQIAGPEAGEFLTGAEEVGGFRPYDFAREDLRSAITQREQQVTGATQDVISDVAGSFRPDLLQTYATQAVDPSVREFASSLMELQGKGYSPERAQRFAQAAGSVAPRWESIFGAADTPAEQRAAATAMQYANLIQQAQPTRRLAVAPEDLEAGGFFGVT